MIRAEAAAEDKMAALDLALDKMAGADAPRRRPPPRPPRPHTPASRSAQALAGAAATVDDADDDDDGVIERKVGPITVTGDGPLVVREKSHPPRR